MTHQELQDLKAKVEAMRRKIVLTHRGSVSMEGNEDSYYNLALDHVIALLNDIEREGKGCCEKCKDWPKCPPHCPLRHLHCANCPCHITSNKE